MRGNFSREDRPAPWRFAPGCRIDGSRFFGRAKDPSLNRYRWLTLLLGPAPIVLGSIALTHWLKPLDPAPVTSNHVVLRPSGETDAGPDALAALSRRALSPARPVADHSRERLESACRESSDRLAEQLGTGCGVIVRAPFVIGGDFSEADLAAHYDRTIGPAARAMGHAYFQIPPSEPITVLLFSGEQSYNRYAQRLFNDEGISVYGYYKPHLRTLVMNIGTGGGTLVHELTHALIDFDFPRVPAWFNEGLASLHEQCHIRPDETGIQGLVNWRLEGLQKALAGGRLRPLASLLGDDNFRGAGETTNYAHARYFCLYLQEQGLLETYYRRFRERQEQDPLGQATVLGLFPHRTWDELDADFRHWAAGLRQ